MSVIIKRIPGGNYDKFSIGTHVTVRPKKYLIPLSIFESLVDYRQCSSLIMLIMIIKSCFFIANTLNIRLLNFINRFVIDCRQKKTKKQFPVDFFFFFFAIRP